MSDPDAAPVPTTSTRASARSRGSRYSDECTTAPSKVCNPTMSSGMEGAVSCPVHTHTASNLSYLVTLSVKCGTSPSPGLLCGRLDFFVDFFG